MSEREYSERLSERIERLYKGSPDEKGKKKIASLEKELDAFTKMIQVEKGIGSGELLLPLDNGSALRIGINLHQIYTGTNTKMNERKKAMELKRIAAAAIRAKKKSGGQK